MSSALRNLVILTVISGIIGFIFLIVGIYFISTNWYVAGIVGTVSGAYLLTVVPDNIRFIKENKKR